MTSQDSKTVEIKRVYTDQDLDGVLLQQLGARDENSRTNALQAHAPTLDYLARLKATLGKEFKVLDKTIERLEKLGNFELIQMLDPQSQAIVKTARRPTIQEVK